jgi:hypothetical protein
VDLLAAWVLFPAVALAVCLGIGLLVERASGARLPGALLLPAGMAGLVGLTQLTTRYDATAEATLPLVVIAAVAGWILGSLHGRRPDRWLTLALAGVAAVFAAPVVLSGDATFAGYTILGDTSIHFIGADGLLRYGREFGGLPPSSYEYSLVAYYGANGYPSGGPTAVGALTSLVHIDVAWTFQPFLTLLVVLMGAALWSLAGEVVREPRLRAAVTFLATQPALVLAYALQGSVKEVGTAYAVVLVGALIPVYVAQARDGWRRALPLGVACAAAIGIVGIAAGVWLGPLMLGALAATWLVQRIVPWAAAVAFLLAAAVLSYQMLLELTEYVDVAGGVVTAQQEFGNLLGPLDTLQKFGIWLSGDYRYPPGANLDETRIGIGLVLGSGIVGAIHVLQRRAWALALFCGVSFFAYWYVVRAGSPWADGKALMIVSPAVMLIATVGAASMRPAALRWGVLGLIGVGVLWSNALAYHDVSNAPRERFAELDEIGDRIAGEGPTLYTEFEEFAKHFLREGAPEGSSEGWQRRYAESKAAVRFGFAADLDQLPPEYLQLWDTFVLRRGYATSRPPSNFERTFEGRFYDVWQRRPGEVSARLAVGGPRVPAARPDCGELQALAESADRLAYVPRRQASIFTPSKAGYPRGWFVDPTDDATLRPVGQGRVSGPVRIDEAGEYRVWAEGSFGRPVTVKVDGRELATIGDRLNNRLTAEDFGTVTLEPGRHTVEISQGGGSPAPGNGGLNRLIGPVALVPADEDLSVRTIDADDWRTLCGQTVDWVEAVG